MPLSHKRRNFQLSPAITAWGERGYRGREGEKQKERERETLGLSKGLACDASMPAPLAAIGLESCHSNDAHCHLIRFAVRCFFKGEFCGKKGQIQSLRKKDVRDTNAMQVQSH